MTQAPRRWEDDPLLVDIVDALLSFHGSAHRSEVAEVVARRHFGDLPPPGFHNDVYHKVMGCLHGAEPSDLSSIVYLPFGETSYRWALTHEAFAALRRRSVGGG